MGEVFSTAEIAEINSRIEEIEDPRECYRLVKESIKAREQRGDVIPEDLLRLERTLFVECNSASQGR